VVLVLLPSKEQRVRAVWRGKLILTFPEIYAIVWKNSYIERRGMQTETQEVDLRWKLFVINRDPSDENANDRIVMCTLTLGQLMAEKTQQMHYIFEKCARSLTKARFDPTDKFTIMLFERDGKALPSFSVEVLQTLEKMAKSLTGCRFCGLISAEYVIDDLVKRCDITRINGQIPH
jgi:hypothetical protein